MTDHDGKAHDTNCLRITPGLPPTPTSACTCMYAFAGTHACMPPSIKIHVHFHFQARSLVHHYPIQVHHQVPTKAPPRAPPASSLSKHESTVLLRRSAMTRAHPWRTPRQPCWPSRPPSSSARRQRRRRRQSRQARRPVWPASLSASCRWVAGTKEGVVPEGRVGRCWRALAPGPVQALWRLRVLIEGFTCQFALQLTSLHAPL